MRKQMHLFTGPSIAREVPKQIRVYKKAVTVFDSIITPNCTKRNILHQTRKNEAPAVVIAPPKMLTPIVLKASRSFDLRL